MKKIIMALALIAITGLGSVAGAAEEKLDPANPVAQFTGKYWVNTQEKSKEAYLYGLESAIALEKSINEKLNADAKRGKKVAHTLSPFEIAWMKAFQDTTRKQIMEEINQWYAAHPDQLDRSVMSVIWYELIVPRLEAQQK